MPRGVSKDIKHFEDVLREGVVLVGGDAEGHIDIGAGKDDPVWVAVVVDVQGYGPHTGVIYAYQNSYHGNPDTPLQEAYEILEDWKREHYGDDLKELEEEYGDRAGEVFTETFDAWSFKLDPREFGDAIRGSKAAKYVDTYDSHAERREELREKLGELRKFYARHYEGSVSSHEVSERAKSIERLLKEGDLKTAEREIESLDKLI